MTLFEAVELAKTFPTTPPVHALRGVSFTVDEGESLAIIGESGSGKTTIARILLGLEHPTSGTILRHGEQYLPWESTSAAERRARAQQIQLVFQDPYVSLNPRQPIRQAIGNALRLHGANRTDAETRTSALLAEVGLGEREGAALPRKLSGGQRQRAAIARALAVQPRVLILDEAVASLDVSVQATILNLLNELRERERVTYLFITHNLAVAKYVTDHAIVLENGAIVEHGTTRQVLEHPTNPYTQRLLQAVPGRSKTPAAQTDTVIS